MWLRKGELVAVVAVEGEVNQHHKNKRDEGKEKKKRKLEQPLE